MIAGGPPTVTHLLPARVSLGRGRPTTGRWRTADQCEEAANMAGIGSIPAAATESLFLHASET